MCEKPKDTQNIVIRDFKIDDYDAIIQLWQKAELTFKPVGRDKRENIENELENPNAVFLVSLVGNKIIGVVFVTQMGEEAGLTDLQLRLNIKRNILPQNLSRRQRSD